MSVATKVDHETVRSEWFDATYQGTGFSRPLIGPRFVPAVQVGADMVAIIVAGIVASLVCRVMFDGQFPPFEDLIRLTGVSAILFPILAHGRGLYATDGWRNARKQAVSAFTTWATVFAILAAVLFILKTGASVSRGAALVLFGTGSMAVVMLRFLASRMLDAAVVNGLIAPRPLGILAVGSDTDFEDLKRQAQTQGRRIVRAWRVASFESAEQASDIGRKLARDLGSQKLERLMIMASTTHLDHVHRVSDQLRSAPFAVTIVLDKQLQWLSSGPVLRLGDCVGVEVSREPLRLFERMMKRTLDIVVAAGILLVIAPFLMLVALAIRIDSPGKVIFRQRRDGFCGKPFYIYKFRSMVVMEDGSTVSQARRDDERVTRVGRLIRRTSIDELPQLWNVLRGDMSLVGPRPHAVSHGELYSGKIPDYSQRHHVKPGLTGWAQVNGCRGETRELEAMERRVERDLWYISHWSMWLDIKIIVRTAWIVLMDRNAF